LLIVRLTEISPARLAAMLLGLVVLLAAGIWMVGRHLLPPPPKVVVMSTGASDGAYHGFALRYREILARHGVTLKLVQSSGAVENLERLKKREGGVQLALVQGGIGDETTAPGIVTLGSLFYEPFWIFVRDAGTDVGPGVLAGKRIAIGVPGSGTRAVALQAAVPAGLDKPPTVLVDLGGTAAADALTKGDVDAAFFIYAPEAPAIERLVRTPGIRLLSQPRAEAFVRRLPFMRIVTLPPGLLDLEANIPPTEIRLLATTAHLLAADDIHPAVVELMLDAARQVHGKGGLLNGPGEFPAPFDLSFALSPDADRYYKGGRPALRRYLPFWAAVWIERTVFFVIPLLALAIPIFHYFPALWRWRARRNVYRWYGELKDIDRAARRGEGDLRAHLARLDEIDNRLDRVWVPLGFANELYTLRMHLRMVQEMVQESVRREASRAPRPADDVARWFKQEGDS
jgi:TRAP-type uncharacterized transport system substrate-binding protein